MTDWPEAVREYEESRDLYDDGMVWRGRADAAIAALKKMQMDTIEVLNDCQAEMGRQCARAEKAEAELAKFPASQRVSLQRAERAEADARGYKKLWEDCTVERQKAEAENEIVARAVTEMLIWCGVEDLDELETWLVEKENTENELKAEAEVERLRWMLDEALHDEWLVECVWRGIFDEDEAVIAMKADLAARYEKERDD